MGADTEFRYRAPWQAPSSHPGSHGSRQRGDGSDMRSLLPLHAGGDPRRIDLRASARDPHGQLLVRVYRQKSSIPVHAFADVSASMGFTGRCRKYDVLVEFISALARSAARAGDRFAMSVVDTKMLELLSLPPMRGPGAAELVVRRLHDHRPTGCGAGGLLEAAERMSASRAMVFVVSDFHFPVPFLRELLSRLGRHAVVPVVIVDSAEPRIPRPGITTLLDPETGAARTLLLRRRFAQGLRLNYLRARHSLERCLADFELRPLYLVDGYDAETVDRYFHG